jgi:hypothetical protein
LPAPAKGMQATDILRRVADASKPFGTKVSIAGDSAQISLKGGN